MDDSKVQHNNKALEKYLELNVSVKTCNLDVVVFFLV